MLVSALPAQWRSRATELERYAPVAAQAFRDAAEELEKTLDATNDSVTLREAAAIGGYSIDALQRLVAQNRIDNVGRKGKPRIRRADVPTKPGHRGNLPLSSGRRYVTATAVVASA